MGVAHEKRVTHMAYFGQRKHADENRHDRRPTECDRELYCGEHRIGFGIVEILHKERSNFFPRNEYAYTRNGFENRRNDRAPFDIELELTSGP